jgi:hypothetical protein
MTPPAATAEPLVRRAERRAATDPGFAGALLDLVDAPGSSAGSFSRTAAGAVNRQRRDDAGQQFLADALPTAEVQQLLGLGTPQAVHRLRSRGKLIGRQVGNATWFPRWQFRGGERRPRLDEVLDLLRRFTADAVAADRVMRLERAELDGRSIADSLDDPRTAPVAWTILSSLGA